jgi:hypothetical protein
MTPSFALDGDALAAYVNGSRASVRYRLDDGPAVDLPDPARLAAMLGRAEDGLSLYRRGSALLARPSDSEDADPEPVDLDALVEDLRALLGALPPRRDSAQPYRDLALAASSESPRFGDYLRAVVRRLRDDLPPPPRKPRPDRPAKVALPPAERERLRRADWRGREEASSEAVLSAWLDPMHPERRAALAGPHLAKDLHAMVSRTISNAIDKGRRLPDGREYAEPGPRVFYGVADVLLGPRKRTKRGLTYTF